jgi:hypothetical protein
MVSIIGPTRPFNNNFTLINSKFVNITSVNTPVLEIAMMKAKNNEEIIN